MEMSKKSDRQIVNGYDHCLLASKFKDCEEELRTLSAFARSMELAGGTCPFWYNTVAKDMHQRLIKLHLWVHNMCFRFEEQLKKDEEEWMKTPISELYEKEQLKKAADSN